MVIAVASQEEEEDSEQFSVFSRVLNVTTVIERPGVNREDVVYRSAVCIPIQTCHLLMYDMLVE